MKCYHGTTQKNWKLIQEEGVLWGGGTWHKTRGKEGYRYTYLTPFIDVARNHVVDEEDAVILEVDYEPVGAGRRVNGEAIDNYGFDPPPGQVCWQFSVFVPIPAERIRLIEP